MSGSPSIVEVAPCSVCGYLFHNYSCPLLAPMGSDEPGAPDPLVDPTPLGDVLMRDFDDAVAGRCDLDPHDVLDGILSDVLDHVRDRLTLAFPLDGLDRSSALGAVEAGRSYVARFYRS